MIRAIVISIIVLSVYIFTWAICASGKENDRARKRALEEMEKD